MQKLPLQLFQLVDIAKTVNGGFEEVRNYFMMLIMTLGMMRESEAANLEFANVSVQMLRGEVFVLVGCDVKNRSNVTRAYSTSSKRN